jgi:hypothetical protein
MWGWAATDKEEAPQNKRQSGLSVLLLASQVCQFSFSTGLQDSALQALSGVNEAQ